MVLIRYCSICKKRIPEEEIVNGKVQDENGICYCAEHLPRDSKSHTKKTSASRLPRRKTSCVSMSTLLNENADQPFPTKIITIVSVFGLLVAILLYLSIRSDEIKTVNPNTPPFPKQIMTGASSSNQESINPIIQVSQNTSHSETNRILQTGPQFIATTEATPMLSITHQTASPAPAPNLESNQFSNLDEEHTLSETNNSVTHIESSVPYKTIEYGNENVQLSFYGYKAKPDYSIIAEKNISRMDHIILETGSDERRSAIVYKIENLPVSHNILSAQLIIRLSNDIKGMPFRVQIGIAERSILDLPAYTWNAIKDIGFLPGTLSESIINTNNKMYDIIEIDVTAAVRHIADHPQSNNGFLLMIHPDDKGKVAVYSQRFQSGAYSPKIIVKLRAEIAE